MKKLYGSIIIILVSIHANGQEPIEPKNYGQKSSEIIDIKSWDSPVKKVFQKYKLPLIKVEYYYGDAYPVFFTSIPWEPMSGPNNKLLGRIEGSIFLAVGRKSYTIIDINNKICIEIKTKRTEDPPTIEENIIILDGGHIY